MTWPKSYSSLFCSSPDIELMGNRAMEKNVILFIPLNNPLLFYVTLKPSTMLIRQAIQLFLISHLLQITRFHPNA